MAQDDIIITMQKEVAAALTRPAESVKWGMLIDTRKCVGCHACTIGCVSEYKLPPGVVYRPVMDEETGNFPKVKRSFLPRPCMQCENPPCVKVCPVGATFKRNDEIVEINYEKCIGCRSCIANCPYGARTFDTGSYYTKATPQLQPYETATFYEYGKKYSRAGHSSPVIGSARKCHFCTCIRHNVKYEDTTIFSGYPAKRPWFPLASDVYQEVLPSMGDAYPYPCKALFLYMGFSYLHVTSSWPFG